MIVLSLDSAGWGCSACVWKDGKVLAQAAELMERGQDRRLMPLVNAAMEQAQLDFPALDRIAVTRGPGSFTGLRIGLAAARGLGLAADKPVLGVDRFMIYRTQFPSAENNLLVVIASKRDELYCQFYPAKGAADKPQMWTKEEIVRFVSKNKNTFISGDISIDGQNFIKATESETVTCAALAARADIRDPAFLPRPLYIRPPDVTLSRETAA